MEGTYKLNDRHIVEATDWLYVTQAYIEQVLVNYALIDAVPEFQAKVEKVQALLAELYQGVGIYSTIEELKYKQNLIESYE